MKERKCRALGFEPLTPGVNDRIAAPHQLREGFHWDSLPLPLFLSNQFCIFPDKYIYTSILLF